MSQTGGNTMLVKISGYWHRYLARTATRDRLGRLLREGTWVALGQVGSAIGLLVGMRLLTEYLAPDLFAAANLLLGIIAFGNCMINVPVLQAAMRFYPDQKPLAGGIAQLRRIVLRSLSWTTALLILLLFGGGFFYYQEPSTWLICVILAGQLVVDMVRSLETTMYNAARRQVPAALWTLADAWARPIVVIVLIWTLGVRVEIILLGYLLASLAVLLVFQLTTRREGVHEENRGSPEADRDLNRQVWSYTLPLIPLGVVAWTIASSDRYIVGGILGLEAAGLYIAAYQLTNKPMAMALGIIETTLRPIYYNAHVRGDRRTEYLAYALWVVLLIAGCAVCLLLLYLLKDSIVALLLGKRYGGIAPLMFWLALGNFFWVLGLTCQRPLYAQKKMKTLLVLRSLAAAITVGVLAAFCYAWGLFGAAIACPVYGALELIITVVYLAFAAQMRART